METSPLPNEPPPQPDIPLQPQAPFLQHISGPVFAIVSLCIIFFLYQVVGGVIAFVLFRGEVAPDNVWLVRWMTMVAQMMFILVPTLVLVRLRYPGWKDFFRIRVPGVRETLLSVVAVFALQQLLQGYMQLQDSIPLPPEIRHYVDFFRNLIEETYKQLVVAYTPGEFIFVVIVIALTPAISEELLFRGLVQRSFEERTNGVRAAVIAGALFGAYHLNPFSLLPLVALGVYFGFLVYRSQNISVAVSAHFFNNFIACTAAYMRLDDDFVALAPQGSPSGVELFFNYVVFGVVFVLATYYFVRVTNPRDEATV